jgi:hypothetical protein
LASIGSRISGLRQKIPVDSTIIPKRLYEVVTTTDKPPANEQEALQMCNEMKAKAEADGTTHVTFVEVRGNYVTMQFWCSGTPSIIFDIILIAIVAVLVAMAISAVLHEAYQILQLLGAETVQMIVTVLIMVVIMSFVTRFMEMFRGRE